MLLKTQIFWHITNVQHPIRLELTQDSKIMNNNSKPFLFADYVSIIVTNPNPTDFKNDISTVFEHINVWFKVNLIS